MKIALFPLNLVVFPGENLNLHIFESRYKDLIADVKTKSIRFGIPAFREGDKMEFGTEVKLEKIVKTYEEGNMDISTRGMKVFRILNFESQTENKTYPEGEIEFLDNHQDASFEQTGKILAQIKVLYEIMKIKKAIPENNKDFSVFQIAHKIGLNFNQEKMLLETPSESDRQTLVHEHLKNMIPLVDRMEEMRKKIQMNGHFKNIIPPKV